MHGDLTSKQMHAASRAEYFMYEVLRVPINILPSYWHGPQGPKTEAEAREPEPSCP